MSYSPAFLVSRSRHLSCALSFFYVFTYIYTVQKVSRNWKKKDDGTGIRTHLLCKIGKITVTGNKKFPKVANLGTYFQ